MIINTMKLHKSTMTHFKRYLFCVFLLLITVNKSAGQDLLDYSNSKNEINISALSNGIYFIKTEDDYHFQIQKLIILK